MIRLGTNLGFCGGVDEENIDETVIVTGVWFTIRTVIVEAGEIDVRIRLADDLLREGAIAAECIAFRGCVEVCFTESLPHINHTLLAVNPPLARISATVVFSA